jgi:hypothetical protein
LENTVSSSSDTSKVKRTDGPEVNRVLEDSELDAVSGGGSLSNVISGVVKAVLPSVID